MNDLALHYVNGEGTEKNLEKAFCWYQKAAEKDHIDGMYGLANRYYNGEGTEKNLEKAFHWYQKAAEKGHIDAIFNLAACYRNGEGTEKNLEKAFYWHQIVAESYKTNSKDEVEFCNECKLLNTVYQWCQQCNTKRFQQDFSKWTSKNKLINKFIQEAQINAKNSYEILEWIPYNNLSSIDYYTKGGFSEIHKAIWSDGPIFSWNFDKQQWNRQTCYEVILKKLNNSSSLNSEFLDEWKYHYNYLMKKCWDSNPSNRPTIIILENIISEWIRCINIYYEINKDGNYIYSVPITDNQLKNDMFEFIEADKALLQEQVNVFIMQSHPQAYYISRKLTEILVQEESQGFDCMIKDY
ncbi:unnamed protein product [Rhizophagus irregularis]|nr:unnamed protein product [Rhizophagus irregularis]